MIKCVCSLRAHPKPGSNNYQVFFNSCLFKLEQPAPLILEVLFHTFLAIFSMGSSVWLEKKNACNMESGNPNLGSNSLDCKTRKQNVGPFLILDFMYHLNWDNPHPQRQVGESKESPFATLVW